MAYNQIPPNVISTANSTTGNLSGGATFTGTSEDVSSYALIQISVFSSHVSATNGLSLQQSSDGTNWDITDTYTVSATTAKVISIQPAAKFYRLVYTNGATLTTSLRIMTVFHWNIAKSSSVKPADGVGIENDFEQVVSVLMGYNGSTTDLLRSDITNGLDVDVTRLSSLVAGSAIIGKVGIDQTTPGTTNLISLSAETTKVIGTVNQGTSPWATSNATTSVVGNGAAATAQRVTLANDSTGILGTVGTVTTVTTLTGTTTLTPGTAATNLGKAEDAAHTTGDVGVMALAVRNDNAATTTTNANADYQQISADGTGTVFVRQSPANTPTLANVAGSVTTVTLLAANAARRTAIFYNDSTSDCYVKYGATASTTSFTYYLPSLGTLSIDGNEYAGLIAGIWISAVGNMRVTETSI